MSTRQLYLTLSIKILIHDLQRYGVVKDKDLAKFEVNLIESTFLNGEPVVSSSGKEAKVIIGKGKTRNVLG